jgi:hypothetical protein
MRLLLRRCIDKNQETSFIDMLGVLLSSLALIASITLYLAALSVCLYLE